MDDQAGILEQLLTKNGLKRTGPRLKVLGILSSRDSATSQPYLEKVMGEEADRVTLYRILQTFEEKGIIHKVLDNQGTANYAICSHKCTEQSHHDEHLHFNCTNCKNVYCLNAVSIPTLKPPVGFTIEKVSLIASGTCPNCSVKIN